MSEHQSTFGTPAAPDIGPEDEAKEVLTEWLENHGATVYWEKRNDFSHPTFHIEGEQRKPDLLVDFEQDGISIAVETKDGSSKSNIYDAAPQLRHYWVRYVRDEQSYVADGVELSIDGFVTATQHSIKGHLFEPEVESLLHPGGYSSGRIRAIDMGELPRLEFNMTEQHIRSIWRTAKEVDPPAPPAIGALLSTVLTGDFEEPAPAVLWTLGRQQGWREFR